MKITTEVSKKLQSDLGSIANSIKDNSSPFHCHLALAMAMCRRWNSILELEDQYRWRDVKEELPEEGGFYLVRYSDDSRNVNFWTITPDHKGKVFYWVFEQEAISDITHWMPMPEFEVKG